MIHHHPAVGPTLDVGAVGVFNPDGRIQHPVDDLRGSKQTHSTDTSHIFKLHKYLNVSES